jgi:Ca2+/Na+ antiporter
MGKKAGLSPLSVIALVAIALPYIVRSDYAAIMIEDNSNEDGITNGSNLTLDCVFGLLPCSITITGNLVLVVFYGAILAAAAKLISDGAEMLLDLGLPPTIIGGIVLPLLGAVPDSAMIIASGSSGDPAEADKQISVGMGTLAGSTIMLLTIPWFGAMILGRVDIVNKKGIDGQCSRFKLSSFWKSGVSVTPDVTYGAIIMMITSLPYLIIQGADWAYGANRPMDLINHKPPVYIKITALITFGICMVLFIGYLVYLLIFSAASKRKDELRKQQKIQRNVLKIMILQSKKMSSHRIQKTETSLESGQEEQPDTEKKPLVGGQTTKGLQKKYFGAWKIHKKDSEATLPKPEEPVNKIEEEEEEEVEEPKWKIAIWSAVYLIVGVALVTIFSDPMVDTLTRMVDPRNYNYYFYNSDGTITRGQYINIPVFYLSFVITPICSNASELVSSLIFASKKKKINSSMTYSQLYGAATMNNTLCLGIFAALVGFRGLTWQYSAEVTVILLVQFIMGAIAVSFGFFYNHTYIVSISDYECC